MELQVIPASYNTYKFPIFQYRKMANLILIERPFYFPQCYITPG